MRCPCCDCSLPDAWIVQSAASINGRKGVKGGKRIGAGRPKKVVVTPEPAKVVKS
jgi:hypothetical protein